MDCCGDTTVDLCSEPECINSTVTFGAINSAPHTPNHRMFKVHRFIPNRDVTSIEKVAEDALNSARETLSRPKGMDGSTPVCKHCKTKVSPPCWYCVDCVGEFGPHPTTRVYGSTLTVFWGRGWIHLR